ncbi:integrase core domain-containing protein [Myxococcus xanthus]|uniref:Transposase n=1 Tax=Myxococcus xanthus TaxID=34 RepID=A0A7Y4INM8_MYXXA|nr:transposase [Myxococcus xanthus]NOJ89986.1 transposase [Myxococcus xanthus]
MYRRSREDVYANELPSASHVLAQLAAWVRDYDDVHPHKDLGMRSRQGHRALCRCGATP